MKFIAVVVSCFLSMLVNAKVDKSFISKEERATLLELYTSQGCSSCPRAENWINRFTKHGKLWNDFFPVNFHVDYWDYLGWKDPYAFAEFSQRQRQLKSNGNIRVIATPGFVVDGRGWSGWFIRQPVPFKRTPLPVGKLALNVNGNQADVEFSPLDPSLTTLKVNLIVLGFDQETSVLRGENHGKKLYHQFIALGINDAELKPSGTTFQASLELPDTDKFDSPKKAVVAWVEGIGNLVPIQVTGGWLD